MSNNMDDKWLKKVDNEVQKDLRSIHCRAVYDVFERIWSDELQMVVAEVAANRHILHENCLALDKTFYSADKNTKKISRNKDSLYLILVPIYLIHFFYVISRTKAKLQTQNTQACDSGL